MRKCGILSMLRTSTKLKSMNNRKKFDKTNYVFMFNEEHYGKKLVDK